MASTKIKDFFNGRFFIIPKYQRGYAWEKQNIRELFEDIIESIESGSNHYIGTIVLSKVKDEDERFFIVDGQQRITTISLIICALIRNLSETDAAFYNRFYLKEGEVYRILPNNRDKQFFIDLLEGKTGDPQNKSQRFLKSAMEEINIKVSHIENKLLFLKSIEKLEVMQFIEESEGDAIRIFQTVNDRGKPLSNMEKAKSLLIYFSNRYLQKKLDNKINDYFSDIFELYDDIKHIGEEIGINLIRNRDFNEDNLMRYHFVTFSNENYDPTATYVLQFLKYNLVKLRNTGSDKYDELEKFIINYIESLEDFFFNCRSVLEKARVNTKYYKLFVILNLSATLYPLIIKLEYLNLLEKNLKGDGRTEYSFFDLVELIEVRVYKTRATDPKADISRIVYGIDNRMAEIIENQLIWFNNRWMSKEEFQSNLSRNIYGNRALNHIYFDYCEFRLNKAFTLSELSSLVSKIPTIEHVLSQTPDFDPIAFGFESKEDFIDYEHYLGNLTVIEKSLNSSVQNKNPLSKIDFYSRSDFFITRELGSQIDAAKHFDKSSIIERTKLLADYCLRRWWCDKPKQDNTIVTIEEGEEISVS